MSGIIVDLGTGDGKFVYELAKQYPDRFFIGIDPNHKSLEKISLKTVKKESKGGLKNACYVLGSLESLPSELDGIVNQVFINLPWAGLLEKVLSVDHSAWQNLGRICQGGAYIDVLIGIDDVREAGVKSQLKLPNDLSIITQYMSERLLAEGFELIESKAIDGPNLKNYPSTWAKKLLYTKSRQFYYFRIMKSKQTT